MLCISDSVRILPNIFPWIDNSNTVVLGIVGNVIYVNKTRFTGHRTNVQLHTPSCLATAQRLSQYLYGSYATATNVWFFFRRWVVVVDWMFDIDDMRVVIRFTLLIGILSGRIWLNARRKYTPNQYGVCQSCLLWCLTENGSNSHDVGVCATYACHPKRINNWPADMKCCRH